MLMMKIVIGWKSKNSRLNRSFQRKRRDRLISCSSKCVYFFKTNIIHHRNDKTIKTAQFLPCTAPAYINLCNFRRSCHDLCNEGLRKHAVMAKVCSINGADNKAIKLVFLYCQFVLSFYSAVLCNIRYF